jgi:plastocyanin
MKKLNVALWATLASFGVLGASVMARTSAAEGKSGSVKGTFTALERLKTKGDTSERDVVVYLKEKTPTPHQAPTQPVVVRQENLTFKPHVLPVMAGTHLRFENVDSVVHNVFSSDSCCKVNLDMPAASNGDVVFTEVGVASIICRLHPDMSMFVVTLDNPYFRSIELAKSGGKDAEGPAQYTGAFEIADVPPGDYVLTYWNKRLKPLEFPLKIEEGKATTLDVLVPAAK